MTERTLCIVKPDAMAKRVLGRILAMVEERGLTPVAARIVRLAPGDAERFYAVHRARGFFLFTGFRPGRRGSHRRRGVRSAPPRAPSKDR